MCYMLLLISCREAIKMFYCVSIFYIQRAWNIEKLWWYVELCIGQLLSLIGAAIYMT